MDRPLVALTVGDPAGIGPEIARAALAAPELRDEMRLVAIGPDELGPPEIPRVAPRDVGAAPADRGWVVTEGAGPWPVGVAGAAAGRAALEALRAGAELAASRRVDALVTGPVSKEAFHLAGEPFEGQTELLARWAGATDVHMLGVADELAVQVLTRHLPLVEALTRITPESVLDGLRALDRGLRRLGKEEPRLALAGLNPHAGEAGLLGDEEERRLEPALRRARAEGLDVAGPVSPDAVFVLGSAGAFDGILALYHDQGFIPLKLLAPRRALTVLLGLPYLRVSPAHGTAFDLAGRGEADPGNLIFALRQAARWSRAWTRRGGAPDTPAAAPRSPESQRAARSRSRSRAAGS